MILSTKDIAQRLKVSEQKVRNLIQDRQLLAERIGKQWICTEENFQQYLKTKNIIIEPDDHERVSATLPSIVALSFFSGAMGLDIGMANSGIKSILTCEIDKNCRKTIAKNSSDIALIGDITKYSAKDILDMAKIPYDHKVDVIFGGPPCQAFSTAGLRKGFYDPRGNVFLKYLEIITQILPKYVVIENVRGLLSAPFPYKDGLSVEKCISSKVEDIKGGALLHILNILRNAGYTISFNLYNSANFGSPQIRERVVIIGFLGKKRVSYLVPTHSENGTFNLPPWRTLADAFKTISKDTIHHYINFPECRLKYYKLLKAGEYWKNLPVELQKEAMGKSYYLGGGKTGFYRRLSFDRPSPTLVTNPTMPATDLAHPYENRPLSVEEYKAIQEFPQEWEICGTILEQYKQIGNAVPIKLAEAIGRTIINHMNDITDCSIKNFSYSRYKNTDEISWEKITREQFDKKIYQVKLI